jgi:hypothetical protein
MTFQIKKCHQQCFCQNWKCSSGCGTGGNGWATGGSDCFNDTDVNDIWIESSLSQWKRLRLL